MAARSKPLAFGALNPSGIVYSDYRMVSAKSGMTTSTVPGEGWVKGWALDTPGRDIILVSKHCGPSTGPPSNLIRFYARNRQKTDTRLIVAMSVPEYAMGLKTLMTYQLPPGVPNLTQYRNGGDIVICRLDKPFPKWVTPYKFSRRPVGGDRTLTLFPDGLSQGKLLPDIGPWLHAVNRDRDLVAGNSGLPWFIEDEGEWRVVSHSCKGGEGEGPLYSHPQIYKDLQKRIGALSKG